MSATIHEAERRLRDGLRGRVERGWPLAACTTYRIGGAAELALFPQDVEQVAAAARLLGELGLPWVVLGGGSNVLVSDRGVRGAVMLTTELSRLSVEGTRLTAGAGADSHQVAVAACEAGLTGAEFLSWLPGSIGGACLMNARAHGGEVSGVLRRAVTVDRQGRVQGEAVTPDQFRYKQSPFSARQLIVAEVTLELAPGDRSQVQRSMDRIEAARRANHEMDFPSCGCVFKNDYDIGVSSGQLIDECGLKGYTVGGACVSPYHANFVINRGDATARDVRAVIDHVQRAVAAATGLTLELEVQLLGQWD